MHVLVSGSTGFLGSWVVGDLLAHGHRVTVLVRAGSDMWRLAEYASRLERVTAAIEDHDVLRTAVRAVAPDAVAHLAWRGVDKTHRNDPSQDTNVADSVAFVDIAADAGARVFVGAGSQAEYGPYPRAIREDDLTRPTTRYGQAKLEAFNKASIRVGQRGIRFGWLRVFSAYGPKDNPGGLIPDLIQSLRNREKMSLTGCEQRWGFIHARDVAAAFRLVIENEQARGAFNVGSPDAPLLRETITYLRDRIAPDVELGIGEIPYRPDQVMTLQADVSRLRSIGWSPTVVFEDGIRETIEYSDRKV